MSKVVVALGGNALGNTPSEQLNLIREAAKSIVDLIEQGHQVIVVHGNGPQVGAIHLAFDTASKQLAHIPFMPFPECGAMSQGYIGYHLQTGINEELQKRSIHRSVAMVLTRVVVDKSDPAFENPAKPIGSFYTKEEAGKLMQESKDIYIEDSGRGYRKVIPSPTPVRVIEKGVIKTLTDAGTITIAAGGGGIPVVEEDDKFKGVEAVIDKDLAGECLAEELDADCLFILTAVEKVAIDFNKSTQKNISKMSVSEAQTWIEEGQFPAGSMLPKVQAAVKFVESKPGRKAIISSLEKAKEAILGLNGTIIYGEELFQGE